MLDYRHVMIATDFSEAGRLAAVRGADLARANGARVTLAHVVEYFPEDMPLRLIAPEDQDPQTFLERHARDQLETLAREVGRPEAECVVVFTTHPARHELPRMAAEREVDLVVVGTHGRRGPGGMLGSTALALVGHAGCDVLVVRGAP
jgi:universal stress protein A